MKRLLIFITAILFTMSASAQMPKGYEMKTEKLAENLVKCSKQGKYNKTYKALRNIQKYEYRLTKEQLFMFYKDIHSQVDKACDKYGLDENGKAEMKVIIDALFSDELKNEVNGQN